MGEQSGFPGAAGEAGVPVVQPRAARKAGDNAALAASAQKEQEAEYFASLKKKVADERAERDQVEKRRKELDRELAEAWRDRQAERCREKRESRARCQEALRRGQRNGPSASPRSRPPVQGDLIDDEYIELMEKYGSLLRVPDYGPPERSARERHRSPGRKPRTGSGSVTGNGATDRQSVAGARKPPAQARRTPDIEAHTGNVFSLTAADPAASRASVAKPAVEPTAAEDGSQKKRASIVSDTAAPSGSLQGAAHTATRASTVMPQAAALVPAPAPTPPAAPSVGPPAASVGGSNQDRSTNLPAKMSTTFDPILMTMKKSELRRKQEQLLKGTEVNFYRSHMRRQFAKILEAVEDNFSDVASRSRTKTKAEMEAASLVPGPVAPQRAGREPTVV